LPQGVPKRVGVFFSGQAPIDMQSSDQFSSELLGLGFDVVERSHLDKILAEQALSASGRISKETAIQIGKLAGVEGIFVGTVTGEHSAHWTDTHLVVNLVNTEDGRIVWGADIHDPRTFSVSIDVTTSIIHTTREAIKLLQQDVDELR
jgi:hypothetical protein